MSKNHPHDNIYSILGKLEALTPKEQPVTEAKKTIYESVESQGSILKGLRKVSAIESRLAEAFAKDKKDDHCKKCDCEPCKCAKEELEESKCNECGMFESKCSCDHTNEGKVEKTKTGIKHTKTDFPGYPSDDLERDDKDDEDDKESSKDKDTGPKKGRPRKVTTKNPRRDPNAEKKGRGRPKKEKSDSGDSKPSLKAHDPFGRVKKDAHKRASVAESMNQVAESFLQELTEGRMIDESGETIEHILNRFKAEVRNFEQGGDLDKDLYDALFDYYFDAGEMPYGVAKARDGDPQEWVAQNLESHLRGDGIVDGNPDEDYGLERESIDPTNPRDYEKPAFLRKQQGQAPLTPRDIMQKDRKPEHDFYQRRTGEVHPDALKTELDELAQLAGLSEVSRGEYIKQQDTAAEKSGKNTFNAFGQLFNTDKVTEDPQPEFEGNEFSGELAKAKAQHKDSFEVDGKEYPVKEDKLEVDGDDEENANKPKPKYGTIKAITTQGDDLNRQKKQDPRTANRAANPLTNAPTLESQLAAEYESIKKSIK